MATNYPAALDTTTQLPNRRANNTPETGNHARDHNNLADSVLAIQKELGVNPSGDSATVAGRLDTFTFGVAGNTTNDTARVNAALTAARVAGDGIVRGVEGHTFKLSSPLIVGSNTVLDMTGCTLQFASTSVRTNMLQSYAVGPVATATDAATTAGSSVISSPTLAAVAVVGQQLAVVGVGAPGGSGGGVAGPVWLYGTVQSVAGNNITLGGNVNGVAAHITSSGATAYLFNRDSNITVVGGLWDAGTNWNVQADRYAAGPVSSLLRLRRVDGLTVKGVTLKQTSFPQGGGWCFGINPQDCTDVLVDACAGDGSSTVVQGQGPLSRVTVRNIRGQTQDDMVAFGTVGAPGDDTEGDITGVLIDGVQANTSWKAVSLFAGQGANSAYRPMAGVMARAVRGKTIRWPVLISNYAGNAQMDVELADLVAVSAAPATYPQVSVSSGQSGIVVTGPKTGRVLADASITANQTGLNSTTADITGLSVTFTAPPSGAVWLEVYVYTLGQNTSASQPLLTIADSANAGKQSIGAGNMAAGALSPSLNGRVKITGLTPGTSYTYKLRGRTASGTADLYASATSPASMRAVAA